jgi:uncharacterized membrane protein
MTAKRETKPVEPILLERMLFFSDAVFAIVLTLLALGLPHLPDGTDDAHLMSGLSGASEPLIAFVVSFGIVGLFWLVHVITLRTLAAFDWLVAAMNVVFLFTVTLTPFGMELVGRFGRLGEAWRLYCALIIAISLASCALIAVSHRDESRILLPEHHGRLWRRLSRAITPGVAFAIGLALSFARQPVLASYCWVLAPVLLLTVILAEGRS